jgi:folate-binding protein YgfZ
VTTAIDLPLLASPSGERVVAVRGADRLAFLDDTTSQALRDAAPGTATAALVLDANGLPLVHLEVLVRDDDVLLVVADAASVGTVMAVLAGRTFLADARFAPLDDEVVVVHGPGAADVVAAAGRAVADGRVATHGAVVVADARHGARRLIGPHDDLAAAVTDVRAAGAGEGTAADLDAWRIAAGVPTWGREVAAPHLPEELGLLPTHVHLAKGCYPGQEAVARMWMLGRPRRRLARVGVSGDLAPGWATGSGRDEVRLTGIAAGYGVGLALVPGDAAPGSRFDGDGGAVEVLDLPGDDPVPPGHDPRMRRRRDRPRGGDAGGDAAA